MDLQLTDRVHIVTGGARGLGRASAEALVAEGARVVLSGRSQESLGRAAAELDERAGRHAAVAVTVDNADRDAPARLLAAGRDAWGRVDGALISVGGPPKGPVTATTDEQWTSAFESVFLGAVRLAREVGTALPAGGALGLVLSSSVRAPLPEMAISNGLRPGLAMVAKTLADELGPRGVRVNGLLPGRIATDRVAELDASTGDPEAARRAAEASIPLGRYGEPEEFGAVAAFLMSPAASFLTGVMLPVDGGLLRAL
ncbi:3-oxoacyl-[acyl-carrier protein] reductase [Nocardioides cavernae]|uniref:3-oxoacyl-[acyl-carrier protein] reductase n=1 Tax=Nocardioides cavernae TaxID=1921566 RepID=A0A7Y9H5H9_9ACTN|nr:SDR family oxidoreductase [Nocardioides cavernae]NYE38284.1 3-oxoacyl-[acyl-carrier protein] reductase [Nocardioides cavernae]